MNSFDLNELKTAKQALAIGAELEKATAKNIGIIGRHAAKLAVQEKADDKDLKKLSVSAKYNVLKTMFAPDIKDAPTLGRAFNDALICYLSADTPVTVEQKSRATKDKKAEKVEVHTTVGAVAETGTKDQLREAAKAAMEASGLGRKSSTRAPRAGGSSAKAPAAKSEPASKPLAMTGDQFHAQILSSVEMRIEMNDTAFIAKLVAMLQGHGITVAKKRAPKNK